MLKDIIGDFISWDLDKWSQVTGVVGFIITIIGLFISLSIKSKLSALQFSYTFDKRINEHIRNLKNTSSQLNDYFNNYNTSTNLIKLEIGKCQSELEDIADKLSFKQSRKVKTLINLIGRKKDKNFSQQNASIKVLYWPFYIILNRFYPTSYEDVWRIYRLLQEVIVHIDNIKKNKKTMLN